MELNYIVSILENSYFPKIFILENEFYGIQYSSGNSSNIKKVLLTVNLSLNAIHYAVINKFSLIISMFGLIEKAINNFETHLINKLKLISKYPLSIFILGSSFIAASGGISDTLVDILYLQKDRNYEKLGYKGFNIPIGRICSPKKYPNQSNEFKLEDLINRIKNNLDVGNIRYVGDNSRVIKNINVIGGEICSIDDIKRTTKEGCQCLLTCNIDYFSAEFASDVGLILVEIPFYEISMLTFNRLEKILSLEFPYIEFYLNKSINPIKDSSNL